MLPFSEVSPRKLKNFHFDSNGNMEKEIYFRNEYSTESSKDGKQIGFDVKKESGLFAFSIEFWAKGVKHSLKNPIISVSSNDDEMGSIFLSIDHGKVTLQNSNLAPTS